MGGRLVTAVKVCGQWLFFCVVIIVRASEQAHSYDALAAALQAQLRGRSADVFCLVAEVLLEEVLDTA